MKTVVVIALITMSSLGMLEAGGFKPLNTKELYIKSEFSKSAV